MTHGLGKTEEKIVRKVLLKGHFELSIRFPSLPYSGFNLFTPTNKELDFCRLEVVG